MSLLRSKDWLRNDPSKKASRIWKAIEKAKISLHHGACYLVGDEKAINIWMDPWVPWIEGFKPKPKDKSVLQNPMAVENLINPNSKTWNQELLHQIFDQASIVAINELSISVSPSPDKLIWILNPKGQFTVKSAYQANMETSSSTNGGEIWKNLWKLKLYKRLKMLLWRIGLVALPTKKMLALKMGNMDTLCQLCGKAEESDVHLFFECHVSKEIWFGCSLSIRIDRLNLSYNEKIVKFVIDPIS